MDLYVCLILIFLFIHQFEIDVNQKNLDIYRSESLKSMCDHRNY